MPNLDEKSSQYRHHEAYKRYYALLVAFLEITLKRQKKTQEDLFSSQRYLVKNVFYFACICRCRTFFSNDSLNIL